MTKGGSQSSKTGAVLIVDDHPLFANALSDMVKALLKPRLVAQAASLNEAKKLLSERLKPELVFLDLNLPDSTGISGFLALRNRLETARIVIVSATQNAEVIEAAKTGGAAGFMTKVMEESRFQQAILDIKAGERFFIDDGEGEVSNFTANKIKSMSQRISSLTPQQTRILELVCEGKLNKQIAYILGLSEATVKTHITGLLRKLEVQNRTQAALLVREARQIASLE